MQLSTHISLADLGGGREGRTPPPGRPNSFDFMQFSGKFGVFTPPLEGSRPPLGKILDPPLYMMVLPLISTVYPWSVHCECAWMQKQTWNLYFQDTWT